jgi:hypothetical protein
VGVKITKNAFFACVLITKFCKKNNHILKYNGYNRPIITIDSENIKWGHYLDSLGDVRGPQKNHS